MLWLASGVSGGTTALMNGVDAPGAALVALVVLLVLPPALVATILVHELTHAVVATLLGQTTGSLGHLLEGPAAIPAVPPQV